MKNENKQQPTPIGTYYYVIITDEEYDLYRLIGYNQSNKPIYVKIGDWTKLYREIPKDAVELIPIVKVKIIDVGGSDYYFVMEYDKQHAYAYNVYSIKRSMDINKEMKNLNEIKNKEYAIYINDTLASLKLLGINGVIIDNLLSLFHIETGIYDTWRTIVATDDKNDKNIEDQESTKEFIMELEDEFAFEIIGYKIFKYDLSVDLSKIVQDYKIICDKHNRFFIITYTAKAIDLKEEDETLHDISDFMDRLIENRIIKSITGI